MGRARIFGVVLCLTWSSQSAVARAADDASPVAEEGSSPEVGAAAQAYIDGRRAYAAGDRTGALRHMRESYRLSQRAELFFNIARLEAELGDCSAAIADYERYLEQAPLGAYRAEAEQSRQQLAASCSDKAEAPLEEPRWSAANATVEPTPMPVPAPALPADGAGTDPPAYWSPWRVAGWSALGSGVLTGIAALAFRAAAVRQRDKVSANIDAVLIGKEQYDEGLARRQHVLERDAQWLGVAAGTLCVGGALLLWLAPEQSNRTITTFQVGPRLVAASYMHRF